ncbi:MAG: hypothetical protein Q7R31_02920 [Candidatus Levybacteria bacterium]|nr:hypothetical protein [Candidatus Levybacteria bacterium]
MKRLLNLFLNLSKKTEKVTSEYQGRLLFLMIILLTLTVFANLPYFNILLTISNIIWIMILVSLFIFRIRMKNLLLIAIILIGTALISVLADNREVAEILGNSIYLILIIVFTSNFVEYLKEIKKS